MNELLPYVTFALTVVIGIISFFIKRELDNKDLAIGKLENRVTTLEERLQNQEISQTELKGKLETVIQILERVERKLEEITHV